MISIIIPLYNSSNRIKRCLESIFDQTYNNFEIILVDDGSIDQSGLLSNIIISGESNTVLIHETNRGAALARNAALELARGEYIAFIDSDDWIESEYLEILVRAIEQYNADITQCFWRRPNTVYKDEHSKYDSLVIKSYNRHEVFNDFLNENELGSSVWGKLFKRDLFDDVRFPEMRTGEDSSLLLMIYKKVTTVVSLPYVGYIYEQNPYGLSLNRKNDLNSVVVGRYIVEYAKAEDKSLIPSAMTKYAVFLLDAYYEAIINKRYDISKELIADFKTLDIKRVNTNIKTIILLYMIRLSPPTVNYYLSKHR